MKTKDIWEPSGEMSINFLFASPLPVLSGVWRVTMETQSWLQGATVEPACVPMVLAADASFLTAVTFWLILTNWCVCAALATKVYINTHTHY